MAVMYCMIAAAEHWSRIVTRLDARIYPFGGVIRDMRLVPRRRSVIHKCVVTRRSGTTESGWYREVVLEAF